MNYMNTELCEDKENPETNLSLLDDFLGGSVEDTPKSKLAPELLEYVELKDGEIDPRYLRTSYSSASLLHGCERKFQLKCLSADSTPDDSTSVTFAFGSCVGIGIAALVSGKSLQEAIFEMFLEWDVDYLASNLKQKKSFPEAVFAIQKLAAMMEDGYLEEYEVAEIEGKPAVELGFCIEIQGNKAVHYYRGYMDIALYNKITGEYTVLENKTSSGTWVNHVQYKNSAQALGYGVVLDSIAGEASSYEVMYNIYMTKLNRYEQFTFPKNYNIRALWLRDLIWDAQLVELLVTHEGNYGIWPMRGERCTDFGRTCEYMDICHLDTANLMKPLQKKHYLDLNRSEELAVYDINTSMEELL